MVGVIGAGAMGGALSIHLARAGRDVTIFATEYDHAVLAAHRRGEVHPALGVGLPETAAIVEQGEWLGQLPKMDALILAVSTAGLATTVGAAAPATADDCVWGVATKGWEEDTLRPATQVVGDALRDHRRVVAVVGPSLANEIAQGVPTAVVCASESSHAARHIAELFDSPRFRTYTSDDVLGVEVGAIMKNVVAIGIGMCDGAAEAFGVPAMTNAKAFVFSRGLVEMARLARALGGRAETILGLAGAGDLFVTALGGRNGRFGRLIGQGSTPQQALEEMNTTVEGFMNARAAVALADRHALDLPVVEVVAKVLHYGLDPKEAIERLVAASVEEEL